MNSRTKSLIEMLTKDGPPSLLTDTEVASGEILLTVLPNIEAETVECYRLAVPASYAPDGWQFIILALTAVLDVDTLVALAPRIRESAKAGRPFLESAKGWTLRAFKEADSLVMEAIAGEP